VSTWTFAFGAKFCGKFAMSTTVKFCDLCKENLITKYGIRTSTVPLFCATTNKEFCSSFGGKPVILSELLRAVGIVVSRSHIGSVCKRCARKIINCYKSYSDIVKALVEKSTCTSASQTPERKPNKRPVSSRTPTGITPIAKKTKDVATNRERPVSSKSKKQLFSSTMSMINLMTTFQV